MDYKNPSVGDAPVLETNRDSMSKYFTSVRLKNFKQDLACLLVLLGTDTLDAKFGCVRTLTHARNCDYLELIERLFSTRNFSTD